jgi:DNA-binding SARP family transcriptional activator
LLGSPRIETGEQPYPPVRGAKSWAVLARVTLAERPIERRELAAELFSEADDPLGALRWCLADLRRALGQPGLLAGDPLSVTPEQLWLDVWALEDGSLQVEEIGGGLLEGIELRNSPGFDTWLLLSRMHWAGRGREELRRRALGLLAAGEMAAAMAAAGRSARLDPLDEAAQELFLRVLVAAGRGGLAAAHLASCEVLFAREGLVPSPALRSAARDPDRPGRPRLRAGVVAASLLRAGTAALDAGAVDAGIETLRRAAVEAGHAGDPATEADVLHALGSALVHAVRGSDGEGSIVLHRALLAARTAEQPAVVAEVLRELAFVDVQAGRHSSADRALREAASQVSGDPALRAGILALRGMNQADRGRHGSAVELLTESAEIAREAGRPRQEAWSEGVLARSLLLSGQLDASRAAAERSILVAQRERWNAFLPWPQVLRAQCSAEVGRFDEASDDAEHAFALGCELGDPCWEGMAARAIGQLAMQAGDLDAARSWLTDAQRRCDRVSDRYVWVSGYIALAQLEIEACAHTDLVGPWAERLYQHAVSNDLPEFLAWAMVYQAENGDDAKVHLVRTAAERVANPTLQARVQALTAASGSAAVPRPRHGYDVRTPSGPSRARSG